MKNSKNRGWVRLHRKIEDNRLWLSEPFTRAQAWIDLFLNANHTDGWFMIRGNKVEVKRGQIGWSEVTMSKRWQWSRNKVRGFLKLLENEQQIEQQKLYKLTTIITINNYENLQTDTTEGQQKDNRLNTNKNVKNDKNVNNIPDADAPDSKKGKNMKPYKEPEIDSDTNELIDDSVENLTDKYNELINYLQKTTGVKIINWPKQRAALKKARIAGIGPGRLKERLHELYEQDWYRTNGLDWGGVISSFDKKS
jgi:hypothetical protein